MKRWLCIPSRGGTFPRLCHKWRWEYLGTGCLQHQRCLRCDTVGKRQRVEHQWRAKRDGMPLNVKRARACMDPNYDPDPSVSVECPRCLEQGTLALSEFDQIVSRGAVET